MSSLTDLRTGTVIKLKNSPYVITWNQFMRKDAGKPVMRTKLKSLVDGSTMDKTFLAGEDFEFADVQKKRCQYLYNDGSNASFMDNENYEQFTIDLSQINDSLAYVTEDTEVYVTFYEGDAIGVQPPPKVELKVKETIPGVKGDTATGGSKPATLETGATVTVPLFIKEGDTLLINTETGDYVKRM